MKIRRGFIEENKAASVCRTKHDRSFVGLCACIDDTISGLEAPFFSSSFTSSFFRHHDEEEEEEKDVRRRFSTVCHMRKERERRKKNILHIFGDRFQHC